MQNAYDIQITDAALSHIRAQLNQTQTRFLRLGVKESGCNGYMYVLDFLEAPDELDLCIQIDEDVGLCVAEDHLDMVSGTEIDLLTQGLNSAMIFKNPKATSYCGCGESFAVDTAGDDDDLLDVGDLASDATAK